MLDPGPTPRSPSDQERLDMAIDERSECGSLQVGSLEHRYVGGAHWAAILDGIADLKNHFDRDEHIMSIVTGSDHDDGDDSYVGITGLRPRSPHALLLYGCGEPAPRSEILAALPPRGLVDRFLVFMVPRHDTDTLSTQLGMYREKIVQCLILGEYTNSGPYALETLYHYVQIEFSMRADADKDIWFLLALAVNMAMRAGYHRDPRHFPEISPFQGEMRRRMWASLLQGDILISSQMGMPRMISEWQCDTAEPRNLNDADFDVDVDELPPPRPKTDMTTVLPLIARRTMFMALGTVMDLTAAVRPCSYAEIMRVDGILHEAAASIPPLLRPKSNMANVTDTPQVIMHRLFISTTFYKGQILLHRRFLYMKPTASEKDPFAYSRKACLDAALGTLQIQDIYDGESSPGGQLYTMRWRISSVTNHEFLTATMILCSLLYRGQTLQRDDEIKSALRKSRTIWLRRSVTSKEARKAAETVNVVLARAEGRQHVYGNDGLNVSGDTLSWLGGAKDALAAIDDDLELSFDGQNAFQDAMAVYYREYNILILNIINLNEI
ncbi:hypothetical protein SLS62_004617 [Diatrype stigma]|uniref:Xylanolytic transcriptional activator regulatory domain-containing protein n=1 Tax=Diatrype stigma TaxID=117547 RepID=A0AAN9UU70_9PEZI